MSMQRRCPPARVDATDRTADAALFKALADPHRLAMLATLARTDDEVCVCDFTSALSLEQPTISHHLRILREAGLVTCERRGTWVYYRLAADARDQLDLTLRNLVPEKSSRMKMHLNLATRDLDRSVAFYSTLLGAEPAKKLPDYALFLTNEPGLELALDLDSNAMAGRGEHFGIVVGSPEAVDVQIARLQAAGHPVDIEREETCCYANQTKVWATDPEGRRWETYFVHGESEARDDADTTCCPA